MRFNNLNYQSIWKCVQTQCINQSICERSMFKSYSNRINYMRKIGMHLYHATLNARSTSMFNILDLFEMIKAIRNNVLFILYLQPTN